MHGRLKIKTTAQQEAEKKKERAVKLGNMSDMEEFKLYLTVKCLSSRLQEGDGGNIVPEEGGSQGREAAQTQRRGADGQPGHPHSVEHQERVC